MFPFSISPKNHLFLPKNMSHEKMEKFLKKFDNVNNKYEQIFIFINSNGGSVKYGLDLADKILESKSEIVTIAHNHCDSAAGFPFVCGHKRFITENTTLLVHPMSVVIPRIQYDQFMLRAKLAKQYCDKSIDIYKERTSLPNYLIEALLTSQKYSFSTQEAIEYKIADKIVAKPGVVPIICSCL